ncbi:Asp23/Gls24 family envelope stress response protein [Lacticaseibacillus jixianensis]|uniref:Stress response regulator gls24 homolog n=1 Tax=Lacticaseibacillus jixianensis TaxID=2486012 RepID=A0ABW4BAR4_9LACO|nr:Asp23/Gls24 family envelope stress response protein [Lacticaseibacillus jixianensis]
MSHDDFTNDLTTHHNDHDTAPLTDDLHKDLGSDTDAPELKKELRFDDAVIQKIAGTTAADIDGLLRLEGGMFHDMTDFLRKGDDPKAGVSVDVDDHQKVTVNLDATMRYGEAAPKIFDQVTDAIVKNVKDMTGMDVTAVKMTVKDMLTDEEIQAEKAKQSKVDEKKSDSLKDDDREMQPV